MKLPYSFIAKINELQSDVNNCTLHTFNSFSLVKRVTYFDSDLTVQLPNPVKLHAFDLCDIHLDSTPYRIILKDSTGKILIDEFKVIGVSDSTGSNDSFTSVSDADGNIVFDASRNKTIQFEGVNGINVAFDSDLNKVKLSYNGDPSQSYKKSYIAELSIPNQVYCSEAFFYINKTNSIRDSFKTGDINGFSNDESIIPVVIPFGCKLTSIQFNSSGCGVESLNPSETCSVNLSLLRNNVNNMTLVKNVALDVIGSVSSFSTGLSQVTANLAITDVVLAKGDSIAVKFDPQILQNNSDSIVRFLRNAYLTLHFEEL